MRLCWYYSIKRSIKPKKPRWYSGSCGGRERERRKEDAKGNSGWMRKGRLSWNEQCARSTRLTLRFYFEQFLSCFSSFSLTVCGKVCFWVIQHISMAYIKMIFPFFLSSFNCLSRPWRSVCCVYAGMGWMETMFTWPACLSCSSLCSSYLSLSFLLFILCCLSISHSTLNFYCAPCKTNFQLSICCSSHSSRFLLHSVTERSKWKINTRRKVCEALVKQPKLVKRAVQWSAGEEKKVRKLARGCCLKMIFNLFRINTAWLLVSIGILLIASERFTACLQLEELSPGECLTLFLRFNFPY